MPVQLGRVCRVLPFVVLGVLLSVGALSIWGRDESLVSALATHLPAAVYCIPALGALLASVFVRSRPAVLAALMSVFLAVVPLGGWSVPSRPAAAGASHRVLTWNVEQFSYGGARLAGAIGALAPDVFCLQEARNYGDDEDPEWPAFEAALPGYQLLRYGDMAIGTRWPVLRERRVPLHPDLSRRPLFEVELQAPDGRHLRVLNVHLAYTGYFGNLPDALVGAVRARRAQAEIILEQLGPSPGSAILCGDLNTTPNSAVFSLLQRRLSDAWRLRGLGFGMTTSVRWPLRRIDYLLVNDVEIGDMRILAEPLSDHRAVMATFALAPD